jgi:hypothetical protein
MNRSKPIGPAAAISVRIAAAGPVSRASGASSSAMA